jgi:hypothetical protein
VCVVMINLNFKLPKNSIENPWGLGKFYVIIYSEEINYIEKEAAYSVSLVVPVII